MYSSKRRFKSAIGTGRRSLNCDSKNKPDCDREAASDCIQLESPAAVDVVAESGEVVEPVGELIAPSGPNNQSVNELGRCNRVDSDLTGFVPGRGAMGAASSVGAASKTALVSSEGADSDAETRAAGEGSPPIRATDVPASGSNGIKVSAPLISRATCIDSLEYSETPGIGRLEKK